MGNLVPKGTAEEWMIEYLDAIVKTTETMISNAIDNSNKEND